jgi:hypothetical protein
MAIGGKLLSNLPAGAADIATFDICVMDAAWLDEVRKQVIENVLFPMAKACGMEKPSPAWWATLRTIDEGSWGWRGSVLSILDLLASGVFTPERVAEIREALSAGRLDELDERPQRGGHQASPRVVQERA